MKEKKNCKIVQDLLPNYIEKLTEKETNQYIEEHLKECSECQKMYDSMKVEVNFSQDKNTKKKINILKKYNMKLNIFKSILIVILLIFIFHVARNMIIINTMRNKRKEYKNCDNFSFKYYAYNEEGLLIREFYQKGEKALEITNHNFMFDEASRHVLTVYTDGKKSRALPNFEREWYLNFLMSMCSFIRSEKCNGVDCYKIYSINEDLQYGLLGGFVIYMEKETGLVVRQIGDANDKERTKVVDWEYRFNTVTDDIFIEPDVSEYEHVQQY